MTNNEQIFYVFDHDENEEIKIIGLENFLDWCNYSNDTFSVSVEKFSFEPRKA